MSGSTKVNSGDDVSTGARLVALPEMPGCPKVFHSQPAAADRLPRAVDETRPTNLERHDRF